MIFALPYICFVLLFFFFQYVPKSIGKTKLFYIQHSWVFLSLLAFLGCRGLIVTDWVSYYPFYDEAPTLFDSGAFSFISRYPWEKGFLTLSCFIKIFTANYFVYQFILFAVDLCIIEAIIREYVKTDYYVIAYIAFFVFQGFVMEVNLLRNSQAILLFLLSLKYVRSKKFFKFLTLNLFGTLFHASSVFYIPLYFILRHTFSKRFLLLAFLFGNAIFFAHISWVSGILLKVLPLLGQSRLASMIKAYKVLTGEAAAYSLGFGFLERTGMYLLVVHHQRKMLQNDEKVQPFINLFYLFSFVYLFLSEFTIFVERISMLFVAGYWIVVPALYGCMKRSWKKCFLLIFILYCILKMLVQCDEPYYRYSNVLLETQNYNRSYIIFKRSMKK